MALPYETLARQKGQTIIANQLGRNGINRTPEVTPTPNIPGGGYIAPPANNLTADIFGKVGQHMAGGVPQGGTATPPGVTVPSTPPVYPPTSIPKFELPPGMGGINGGMSTFQRGPGTPGTADTAVNPEYERVLLERLKGEGGGPGWDDIVSGTYEPLAKIMERDTARARDSAVEDMITRGALTSGAAPRQLGDLAAQLSENKAALLGKLGLDYEDRKQKVISDALQQYGILEGNRIQAKTTITAANIGASAQVQSAALHAGATTQAAAISAQARLQEAGLNAETALKKLQVEMDRDLEMQGFDPSLFSTDPQYRGEVLEYFEYMRAQEEELRNLVIQERQKDAFGVTTWQGR